MLREGDPRWPTGARQEDSFAELSALKLVNETTKKNAAGPRDNASNPSMKSLRRLSSMVLMSAYRCSIGG